MTALKNPPKSPLANLPKICAFENITDKSKVRTVKLIESTVDIFSTDNPESQR